MDKGKTKQVVYLALSVFLVTLVLAFLNPLAAVQFKISDLFFRGRGASDVVTIIAIDEKSLSPEAKLGRFKDWPRTYYAQLIRVLSAQKPAVIAFDLDFREASQGVSAMRLSQILRDYELKNATPDGISGRVGFDWYRTLRKFDRGEAAAAGAGSAGSDAGAGSARVAVSLEHPDDKDFLDSITGGVPVVLTSSLLFAAGQNVEESAGDFPKYSSVIPPIFSAPNVTTGYINVFRDRDGVLRRFAPQTGGLPGFSQAIANAYKGGALRQAQGDTGVGLSSSKPQGVAAGGTAISSASPTPQIPINYAAAPFSFRTISFVDAVNGRLEAETIKDKIVIVGATARTLQDFQATPISSLRMPGVEVNANMVQQLLENKNLSEQGMLGIAFVLAILIAIGAVLFFRLSLRWTFIAFAAGLFGFPFFAYAMHQTGMVMNVVYPELAWIFVAITALWYRNKTELRAKREIKRAFAHYVSPVVVNELAKNPETLKLGGKRENISVMFSDIVGFTTLAEQLTPEDTVALLNDYLTAMTEVVFSFHGTLDKYQGDAIMALFGAPLMDTHHAVNACHVALGMRKALVGLHEKWNRISELPHKDELIKLDFRVGISTGPAVIGNVGSDRRFDYTAIGDIVNLGSRLESINRKYGTHIIVDKGTFTAVTENHNPFVFRKLDTVRVKGKERPTDIFEVVALAENITEEIKAMLDDFESGRILYAQRNFTDAKQYFESGLAKVPEDGPSQIYRNRCNFFLRKPPSMDWNAVVDLEK